MKEASIRKLYVKVFAADGVSKSLLVDERQTVAYILRQLAEKNHVTLTMRHAIVEQYPDLYMERIYEDHEHLIENILMWTRDSPNKLLFVERAEKYSLFENPQEYLLSESAADAENKLCPSSFDSTRKQAFIDEFFAPSHVQPPELEGVLWLKADGKKAWKRHYFVLRASGLYYIPKGKTKSSKDLVCLMQLEMVCSYLGFGWKKKYKAPTDWCFSLKHPQIQVKASKYIKYLCCEDERTLRRWMVGLRLAKNGRQLYDNFQAMQEYLESECKDQTPQMRPNNALHNESAHCNGEGTAHFKDSVVIRPKSTGGSHSSNCINGSASVSQAAASGMVPAGSPDVKLRPRSADIRSAGCGGKRGSKGNLTMVDLPMVPESSAVPISMIPAPGQRRESTNSTDSSTPTAENAFETDVCGTIKRRPGPVLNGGEHSNALRASGLLSPALGARLPLTESTKHTMRATQNRRSSEEISEGTSGGMQASSPDGSMSGLSGSGYGIGAGGSLSVEMDSDEEDELPPPPPELLLVPPTQPTVAIRISRVSGEFPAPPSPMSGNSEEIIAVVQNGFHAEQPAFQHVPSSGGVRNGPERIPGAHVGQQGVILNRHQANDSPSISPRSPVPPPLAPKPGSGMHSPIPSVPGVPASHDKARMRPPAPPKRNENTRLSTVQTGNIEAAVKRGTLMPGAMPPVVKSTVTPEPAFDSSGSVSGERSAKPPPPVAPKPKVANPAPTSNGGAAFMTDLQAAMQRRAQRQQVLE